MTTQLLKPYARGQEGGSSALAPQPKAPPLRPFLAQPQPVALRSPLATTTQLPSLRGRRACTEAQCLPPCLATPTTTTPITPPLYS